MPLRPLQRRVMAAIATQRDPESYGAGAAALQRHGIRGSADIIDIFHDREEALDQAVAADAVALGAAGFELTWERQAPAIHRALVRDAGEATRLEWVVDSDFR